MQPQIKNQQGPDVTAAFVKRVNRIKQHAARYIEFKQIPICCFVQPRGISAALLDKRLLEELSLVANEVHWLMIDYKNTLWGNTDPAKIAFQQAAELYFFCVLYSVLKGKLPAELRVNVAETEKNFGILNNTLQAKLDIKLQFDQIRTLMSQK